MRTIYSTPELAEFAAAGGSVVLAGTEVPVRYSPRTPKDPKPWAADSPVKRYPTVSVVKLGDE